MGVGEPRPSPDLPTLGAEAPHRRASGPTSSRRGHTRGGARPSARPRGRAPPVFSLFISSREDNSNSSKGCGLCGQPAFPQLVAHLEVWTDTGCHPGTSRRTRGELPGSSVRSTGEASCPRVNPRVWAELYPGAAQGDGGANLPRRGASTGLWTTRGRAFTCCGSAAEPLVAGGERAGPRPAGPWVPHTGDAKRPPPVRAAAPGFDGRRGRRGRGAPGCRRRGGGGSGSHPGANGGVPGCGGGTRVRARSGSARREGAARGTVGGLGGRAVDRDAEAGAAGGAGGRDGVRRRPRVARPWGGRGWAPGGAGGRTGGIEGADGRDRARVAGGPRSGRHPVCRGVRSGAWSGAGLGGAGAVRAVVLRRGPGAGTRAGGDDHPIVATGGVRKRLRVRGCGGRAA